MTATKLRTAARTSFDYSRLEASLARFAEQAAVRIRGYQRAASIDIGRELLAVKEHLQHGDFISWIEQECGFGRRTAVNLMQVAQRFGDKWESVSHLPPRLLYALAAPSTPDDLRQQVLDVSSDERLDPSSLRWKLTERRRQDAAANTRRSKELTKGQQAYKRRKAKTEMQKRQKWAAESLERSQNADKVAVLIVDALGIRRKDVFEGLKDIDTYRLVEALRRRLSEICKEDM